jgi:hypothetical protein
MPVLYNKKGVYSPHFVSLRQYVLDPACKGKFYVKLAKKPVITPNPSVLPMPMMNFLQRSVSVREDGE